MFFLSHYSTNLFKEEEIKEASTRHFSTALSQTRQNTNRDSRGRERDRGIDREKTETERERVTKR